jgi:hypothetical protein
MRHVTAPPNIAGFIQLMINSINWQAPRDSSSQYCQFYSIDEQTKQLTVLEGCATWQLLLPSKESGYSKLPSFFSRRHRQFLDCPFCLLLPLKYSRNFKQPSFFSRHHRQFLDCPLWSSITFKMFQILQTTFLL